MSERIKLGILSALLLLVLAFSVFAVVNTFQAVRALQMRNHEVKAGNVSTIRAWMTIPAISHIYHVPEDYVYRSLNVTHPAPNHPVTLYEVANRKQKPVDQVIQTLQHAILLYRKQHPGNSISPSTKHTFNKDLSPPTGRAKS